MLKINWKTTVSGYNASLLDDKYLLKIWQTNESSGLWFAGVNDVMATDHNGKDEMFSGADSAKAAAEELADELMIKDGILDSSGN